MYSKILVGLDGSENAMRAAKHAIELAKLCDAELHILTVTRPIKVTPELSRFLRAEGLLGEPKYVMDEMTDRIVGEAKELAAEAGLTGVKTAVREGKPARSIVEYGKNQKVDLIVGWRFRLVVVENQHQVSTAVEVGDERRDAAREIGQHNQLVGGPENVFEHHRVRFFETDATDLESIALEGTGKDRAGAQAIGIVVMQDLN